MDGCERLLTYMRKNNQNDILKSGLFRFGVRTFFDHDSEGSEGLLSFFFVSIDTRQKHTLGNGLKINEKHLPNKLM